MFGREITQVKFILNPLLQAAKTKLCMLYTRGSNHSQQLAPAKLFWAITPPRIPIGHVTPANALPLGSFQQIQSHALTFSRVRFMEARGVPTMLIG